MNSALWGILLFAFWVLLSGKLDAFHLGMGAASAAAIAWATRPLFVLPPVIGPGAGAPFAPGLVVRFLLFLPWLLWQIVIASLQVAWVVLHPRMPIGPRLVKVRSPLPHTLARLTLANSITLTPGTVTLDVEGDEFLVHALTESSARSLGSEEMEGDMRRRIRAVFGPGGSGRGER